MRNMQNHFSKIAPKYRELRTTDIEPILYIKDITKDLPEIIGADVGCGTGRYSLKLFEHLGSKLRLYCIDYNEEMLKQLSEYFSLNNVKKFKIMRARASELPLENNSLNCIFAFNAIHHFNFTQFLTECSRVLKDKGCLFIYTRLRNQNRSNIWGKFFPYFIEKENRLYELEELKDILNQFSDLEIHSIRFFRFKRISDFNKLLEKARNCHYSTFYLYEEDELEKSIQIFKQKLSEHFGDLNKIHWFDEYTLLVVQKQGEFFV